MTHVMNYNAATSLPANNKRKVIGPKDRFAPIKIDYRKEYMIEAITFFLRFASKAASR